MTSSSDQYGNGFPCAYGMCGGIAIQTPLGYKEVEKHGSSWHIANRKSGYITSFPKRPCFSYVIVLDPSAFPAKSSFYTLDSEFVHYIEENHLGSLHIDQGGGTEWFFQAETFLPLRLAFFQQKQIPILAVLTEDPFPIRELMREDRDILAQEDLAKEKAIRPTRFQHLLRFQEPHLQTIRRFLEEKALAAMIVAVCGYGKTVVTSKSINGLVNRLFICVPTEHLKRSWKKALLDYSGFSASEIFELGSSPSLETILSKKRFVLLLCYASSHLLYDSISQHIDLGVFDEAHRLTGIAEMNDDEFERKQDIGRMKRLIRRCATLQIPRLSLTYTPKSYLEEEFEGVVNSNDDVELFGEPIVKVSLREMIEAKLLPPYQIRFPHVTTSFEGTKAKVQLMLHEFMRQENGQFLMNHLVAFGASHDHCKEILKALQELSPSTVDLVYLETAGQVQAGLERFTAANRAICVNCLLLGEGVDIPIADSTCLLSTRKSYTQIVQMLLRGGRYFPGKNMFYMIMTFTEEEDADFIGYVLDALAQMDPHLDKQLLRLAMKSQEESEPRSESVSSSSSLNDPIQTEGADGHDLTRIKLCIEKVIRRRVGNMTTRAQFHRLRRICQQMGLLNTSQYNAVKEQYAWPEAPWTTQQISPYEFFRGVPTGPMSHEGFLEAIRDQTVLYENYPVWQAAHSDYPSVEDITDGYFGQERNLQTFFQSSRRRR
jgi:superfamily II DNA or RNA helicase